MRRSGGPNSTRARHWGASICPHWSQAATVTIHRGIDDSWVLNTTNSDSSSVDSTPSGCAVVMLTSSGPSRRSCDSGQSQRTAPGWGYLRLESKSVLNMESCRIKVWRQSSASTNSQATMPGKPSSTNRDNFDGKLCKLGGHRFIFHSRLVGEELQEQDAVIVDSRLMPDI